MMANTRTLLRLGCGFEQIEALGVARELGYRTLAFDNDPQAAGRSVADEFFQVDLKNLDALIGQAELCAPNGVVVHAAELVVKTALDATDKSRRIAKLASAGIRTPSFVVLRADASAAAEWIEQTDSIPYPKVLKPTNQAGTRGVMRIDDAEALEAYYAGRGAFRTDHFVCETLLTGVQLSTESVAVAGKIAHHAVAVRHYDTTSKLRPYFIEDGHSMPFDLPDEQRAAVESVIERCFESLGITSGVLNRRRRRPVAPPESARRRSNHPRFRGGSR